MRYCSKCGNNVNENDSFSSKCGNKISAIQNVNQKNSMDFEPNSFSETSGNEDNRDKVYSDDVSSQDNKEKFSSEKVDSKKNQEYYIPWYKKYWKAITSISIVILLAIIINNMLLPKESWVFVCQDSNKVTYWVDENSIKKNKNGWVAFLFRANDIMDQSDVIMDLAVDPNSLSFSPVIYAGTSTENKKDGTKKTTVHNQEILVYALIDKDRGLGEAILHVSKRATALYKEKAGKY